LRRRYCQIFGPSRHFAKLPDSLGRYFDVRIHFNRHLSRQAAESYVKRAALLLGLYRMRALRTLTTTAGAAYNLSTLLTIGQRRVPLSLTLSDVRFLHLIGP